METNVAQHVGSEQSAATAKDCGRMRAWGCGQFMRMMLCKGPAAAIWWLRSRAWL
ncbi:hypothetical protein BIFGAL_04381 [Bifidobacterium gallicum DSM 20093 = LMG 11596]|uniref:Uncharacterized protein n=1 Tax=Bifidobacterium gallicum DSM 20093 = LMG 11596 TaxID=561180 RepID=D1NWX4_9BIFI|nr:hypothetical protein BIFGAL_04381 [Bifidobacterium gallicum DSM 20093 = LMG 11596]